LENEVDGVRVKELEGVRVKEMVGDTVRVRVIELVGDGVTLGLGGGTGQLLKEPPVRSVKKYARVLWLAKNPVCASA